MSDPVRWQAEYEALQARNRDLEEWHKRDALAVEAHKARADHQQSRAEDAEERLACFAGHAERYRQLAELAATGQRDADLVEELRRRIAALERHRTFLTAREPEPAPELAALRELLDEIGVMAANAPEDGDSFGVLEEIAMRIAAAGVPDSAPGSAAPEQLEAK